jgi:uncharacterized OB-fold protein
MTEILTVDQFYSEAKRSGRVLGLACDNGHVTVPPRHSCMVCGSTKLIVKPLSGFGKVASFTEVYVKSKSFPLEVPYVLVLVRLEEGGNLLGVMEEKPITLGTKVKVSFREILSDSVHPTIFFTAA